MPSNFLRTNFLGLNNHCILPATYFAFHPTLGFCVNRGRGCPLSHENKANKDANDSTERVPGTRKRRHVTQDPDEAAKVTKRTRKSPTRISTGNGQASSAPPSASPSPPPASDAASQAQSVQRNLKQQALQNLQNIDNENWNASHKEIATKIQMRGLEPLFAPEMEWDFPNFPPQLFTANDDQIFIEPLGRGQAQTSHFRATHSLERLVYMGTQANDKIQMGQAPQGYLRKEIEAYIKWAMDDADLSKRLKELPNIKIITSKPGTDSITVAHKAVKELGILAGKWRNSLRNLDEEPPSLYGIILNGEKTAVVAYVPEGTGEYEAGDPANQLRLLWAGDLANWREDVWNAIVIAILVNHARNELVDLVDAGRLEEKKEKEKEEVDPDL